MWMSPYSGITQCKILGRSAETPISKYYPAQPVYASSHDPLFFFTLIYASSLRREERPELSLCWLPAYLREISRAREVGKRFTLWGSPVRRFHRLIQDVLSRRIIKTSNTDAAFFFVARAVLVLSSQARAKRKLYKRSRVNNKHEYGYLKIQVRYFPFLMYISLACAIIKRMHLRVRIVHRNSRERLFQK